MHGICARLCTKDYMQQRQDLYKRWLPERGSGNCALREKLTKMFYVPGVAHRNAIFGLKADSARPSDSFHPVRAFPLRRQLVGILGGLNAPKNKVAFLETSGVNFAPLPVILYNIPGRSGVNMTAETTLRLAREMKNVIGIKEASGDIEQMQHILDRRPEGFIVLSGDDGMTLELMRRGGDGVISVAANAFPKRFMECVNYAKGGEFDRAEKAYECLDEAVHALFEEGNPVGVKCALAEMGIIGPTMRLPLVEGSGALREKFRKLIAEYDLR